MALRPSRVALFALSVSFLVACGGSETIDEPAGGAGSGGTAGAAGAGAGATGGASGASGASGKGGSAAGTGGTGGAGASGGSSGASGKGGTGGASGAGGSTAGKGGASGGKGGAAGASGGTGGGGGGTACKVDTDCTGPIPVTTPAGCAELFCEPTSGACAVRARDKDKDGHRGAACKAIDGTSIATGDDCDDNDAETHPGAWDGPADGANPDRCDGKDQNCSNEPDDQKTAAGKSCLCNPGDALVCGEDGGGKTIAFPMLDANGKPVGKCKLGKKTCGGDGKWGPCVGAIPPEKLDICNGGVDDDCDGKADLEDDMPPPNLVTWSYDGDGDGYVDKDDPSVKSSACDDKAPTVCPKSVPGCDLGKWKLGSLPAKDCNDKDGDVNPAGVELCDGVDNDCNGVVDDDYASNASLWYFDWDGDNYGDINTTPKKSCSPPTTFPAGCADLVANTPADYCAGVAGEGNPPTCPVPACDVSMWKKNLPNTDCKDRPDQTSASGTKGSNPALVYPGATDLCNARDYNCDGSVDTGCGCSPVGKEETCGSADTCNAGTRACQAGGTWASCSGGPDKSKVEYCLDGDGDKFCDLDTCVTTCPGTAPAKYIERTQCTGFSQPNNQGDDCDDNDKDVNPGILNEICNGDGKDHNCNGTKNDPGLGDCACTDSPLDQPCNPPATVYPTGKNPGDPLLGECKWGMRKCVFGQYTACTGGVGMEPQELCVAQSSPDYGKDFDCDGKSNKTAAQGGECGCSGTETRPCGCTGTESCSNGAWTGTCNSDTPKKDYCLDADNDQVCAGGCTLKCPGTYAGQREKSTCYQNATVVDCADANNARGQNKPELCSSTDENCDASQLPYDGYTWQNGLGFGAGCTRGKGTCYRTGTNYCATTMATDCSAATVTPPGNFVTAPVSGSYDTTCDGKLQYDSSTALTFSPRALMDKQTNCLLPSAFNCSFAAQVSGIVDQTFYMFVPCASHVLGSLPAPEGTSLDDAPNYSWRFGTVPNCGSTVGWAICISTGSGNYTGPGSAGEINSFKQGCK